ncbi:regulator of ribonuclease activity B [Flavobacterium sp. 81]|uniref:ribonuclease E inhibitor RraB n=1 Tax=unclassified Flavobacterium TaxID=196869 RepID=UPI000EB1F87E|nr:MULTISPECIES: ribonuclease E inhibitor RraB [unclassified Flavobacterium]RKR09965.1 regulator of ribonuclease activity B [Flavobacterium sp. 81]
MKKYFAILFGVLLGSSSCQQKETKNVDVKKQAQIDANLGVINSLRNGGDKLTASREVFHWIYFKDEKQRNNYLTEVSKKGFELVSSNKINDKFPYQLQIKRIDKVDENSVNDYVIYLWEKAIEYNGDYDGWETNIEKT